jgi:Mn-dependent DtxR family transcriptional regulator
MSDWTFFSNYGHVLVCLARKGDVRLRDVALEVGITERAVQKIVRDLQDAGYLTVAKQGRCNRYRINKRKALRHSLESHRTVGKLLALVAKPARTETAGLREQEASAAEEIPAEASLVFEETALSPPETPIVAEKITAERKRERKKEEKRAPIETRKQGKLF